MSLKLAGPEVMVAGCAMLLATSFAATAIAQEVEAITVLGRDSRHTPDTMSYAVSYRDIDLRSGAGQKELNRRVRVTAQYVCEKLGDRGVDNHCYRKAVSDASPKVRDAIAAAEHRPANWKPGAPWQPPA